MIQASRLRARLAVACLGPFHQGESEARLREEVARQPGRHVGRGAQISERLAKRAQAASPTRRKLWRLIEMPYEQGARGNMGVTRRREDCSRLRTAEAVARADRLPAAARRPPVSESSDITASTSRMSG